MQSKTTPILQLLAILAIGAFCFLPACLSQKVQEPALWSPAIGLWGFIGNDFERGLIDGASEGDLTSEAKAGLSGVGNRLGRALQSRDSAELLTIPWDVMRPWCERGIDDRVGDGEIGFGVGQTSYENLRQFSRLLGELRTIPPR